MSPKKIDEQAILDAAAEEFAELGFNGARIDSIAKRADINKAMLYYRVGDKEELYRRVVLRSQASMQNAIMSAINKSTSATETVENILSEIAENAHNSKLIPSIFLREISGNGKTLPEEGRNGIKGFLETTRAMVRMGVDEGTFREIDPTVLQFIITSTVFALSLTSELRQSISSDNPGPLTPKQITESITDIILNGILKEGSKR